MRNAHVHVKIASFLHNSTVKDSVHRLVQSKFPSDEGHQVPKLTVRELLRVLASRPSTTEPSHNLPETLQAGVDGGALGASREVLVVGDGVLVMSPVLEEITVYFERLGVGHIGHFTQTTQSFPALVGIVDDAIGVATLDVQELPHQGEHRLGSNVLVLASFRLDEVAVLGDHRVDPWVVFIQQHLDDLGAGNGTSRTPPRCFVVDDGVDEVGRWTDMLSFRAHARPVALPGALTLRPLDLRSTVLHLRPHVPLRRYEHVVRRVLYLPQIDFGAASEDAPVEGHEVREGPDVVSHGSVRRPLPGQRGLQVLRIDYVDGFHTLGWRSELAWRVPFPRLPDFLEVTLHFSSLELMDVTQELADVLRLALGSSRLQDVAHHKPCLLLSEPGPARHLPRESEDSACMLVVSFIQAWLFEPGGDQDLAGFLNRPDKVERHTVLPQGLGRLYAVGIESQVRVKTGSSRLSDLRPVAEGARFSRGLLEGLLGRLRNVILLFRWVLGLNSG